MSEVQVKTYMTPTPPPPKKGEDYINVKVVVNHCTVSRHSYLLPVHVHVLLLFLLLILN